MGESTRDSTHGIPQFNGCGFDEWQFRVQMHLDSLNLMNVLTDDPPVDVDAKATFLKNDKKAKERIVAFVHNDYLGYVRDKTTAKEMWDSLQSVFAKKSVVSQLLVRKQLAKLRMNEGETVSSHLMVFEKLLRELKVSGATLNDNDSIAQLFLTLPEKFDPLITSLQSLEDGKLTLNLVKERLLSEESKFSDRHVEDLQEKTAFIGKKNQKKHYKFQGKCTKCSKFGHKSKYCRQTETKSEARSASSAATGGVCFMADRGSNFSNQQESKIIFKLDSGASDHLTNDKKHLLDLVELKTNILINVAKEDQSLIAKYAGKIIGTSDKGVDLNMKDVLYCPELRDNLLSVRKLTSAGVEVKFCKSKAYMFKDGKIFATACLRNGLYEMEINISRAVANLCNTSKVQLWHKRLAHIGQHAFNDLVKYDLVTGLNVRCTI